MTTPATHLALERMTCLELLEVIRLHHAIDDAKAAGLDGWEMSLRAMLAEKMGAEAAERIIQARERETA